VTFPAIYTPDYKLRGLRVAGLRLAEIGTAAAAYGAGAGAVLADSIGLHRPAEHFAVSLDTWLDRNNQACSRLDELGAVAPHPAVIAVYRFLGGERIGTKLLPAGTVENDDEAHPGPMLTPDELEQHERENPIPPPAGLSVYAAPEAEVEADPEQVETFIRAILAGEITAPRTWSATGRHYEGECRCPAPEETDEGDCLDVILAAEIDRAETEAYAENYRRDPAAVERDLAAREAMLAVRFAELGEMLGGES
jgi:hypothetical protein